MFARINDERVRRRTDALVLGGGSEELFDQLLNG
jgi:cobyrinic acid a,c-diamide synthase